MNNREGHIFIAVPGTGVLSVYCGFIIHFLWRNAKYKIRKRAAFSLNYS